VSEPERLLLVANLAPEHMGAHFLAAARSCNIALDTADMREAWAGPELLRRLSHHFAGKRPTALERFSRRVVKLSQVAKPSVLLTTGIAPLHARAIRAIRERGVRCINYLTDDPWNRANGAQFFWASLRAYDTIYSPRRANLADLSAHGCADVRYLPFGYNPDIHFPIELTEDERARYACDVAFVGAADADRIALVQPLLCSDLHTKLYGSFWERHSYTRPYHRGVVFERELRAAVGGAKVNLCMGRAANRDGHAMRTFELPAMRACMLVEDTAEHREIFGEDDVCVSYYTSPADLVKQARALCADAPRRERLAAAAHAKICDGSNTYAARLSTMVRGAT
jgi:spore maturation protein CgeB